MHVALKEFNSNKFCRQRPMLQLGANSTEMTHIVFSIYQPPVMMTRKYMYLCRHVMCLREYPVYAMFGMDRAGYVPGQDIVIDAKIENKDPEDIPVRLLSTSVKLRMVSLFQRSIL